LGRVEEKIGEGKTMRDPVDPVRPGQKLVCNPLTFVFLLKRRRFDFKNKLTRTTRSKPGIRVLDWANHLAGSEN
jgi:hypothetical protein